MTPLVYFTSQIMCTVHQPSAATYTLFDKLLLLTLMLPWGQDAAL